MNRAQSQVIQQQRLDIDPLKLAKFEVAVVKKNQIYNNEDGQPRFVTFKVLTGTNAYNYVRMQISESLAEFDEVYKEGSDFSQRMVGPLHFPSRK